MAERSTTAFLIVDFQERFAPVIPAFEEIQGNLARIAQAARILGVPILVTEQYPKGLGHTVAALAPSLDGVERIDKVTFGCFGEPRFVAELEKTGAKTLFVAGIEAHVCVAQTVLQALEKGYRVHLIEDAVGSRNPRHVGIAIERMRGAGAVISCTEMALFELLERAGTPEFKAVQQLVK